MIGCALALIALAGCKTPELSMDERISLPESGEMGMNDTTFVKPLSWDVFFQDTLLRGYVDVALRNNHSVRQQKPFRPLQGRTAHGDALHALPEGMVIA